jgi:uncharacterized protein YjbJ (UPF0337 family)
LSRIFSSSCARGKSHHKYRGIGPHEEGDHTMSNKDKAKNVAQVAKGDTEEAVAKKTGNDKLRKQGRSDQIKGNLKQAGEKVKDAFS